MAVPPSEELKSAQRQWRRAPISVAAWRDLTECFGQSLTYKGYVRAARLKGYSMRTVQQAFYGGWPAVGLTPIRELRVATNSESPPECISPEAIEAVREQTEKLKGLQIEAAQRAAAREYERLSGKVQAEAARVAEQLVPEPLAPEESSLEEPASEPEGPTPEGPALEEFAPGSGAQVPGSEAQVRPLADENTRRGTREAAPSEPEVEPNEPEVAREVDNYGGAVRGVMGAVVGSFPTSPAPLPARRVADPQVDEARQRSRELRASRAALSAATSAILAAKRYGQEILRLVNEGRLELPERVDARAIGQLARAISGATTALDRVLRAERLRAGKPTEVVGLQIGLLLSNATEDELREIHATGVIPPRMLGVAGAASERLGTDDGVIDVEVEPEGEDDGGDAAERTAGDVAESAAS